MVNVVSSILYLQRYKCSTIIEALSIIHARKQRLLYLIGPKKMVTFFSKKTSKKMVTSQPLRTFFYEYQTFADTNLPVLSRSITRFFTQGLEILNSLKATA